MSDLLLFGITGQIGSAICKFFTKKGKKVIGVSRSSDKDSLEKELGCTIVGWDVFKENPDCLKSFGPFKSVCFSQGKNLNDSIYNFDEELHYDLYKANCLFILSSLNKIVVNGLLAHEARHCIISSIWQNIARQDKLSYCVTKSALQGMVNSLAVDMAKEGSLVNAILPGALDTQMTRNNLNPLQLEKLQKATLFNRLANIDDIAALAYFLCSEENTSITGQFINVDLGFENAKIL